MPSLSGSGNEARKLQRRPTTRRKKTFAKSKKGRKKAAVDQETPVIREVHEHFLLLLRKDAKALNDPLLLYLYDMVIHRNRSAASAEAIGGGETK